MSRLIYLVEYILALFMGNFSVRKMKRFFKEPKLYFLAFFFSNSDKIMKIQIIFPISENVLDLAQSVKAAHWP